MTTPGLERRARWWNTLYWRVGLGFVGFVVALLLVQSAIFIYWVDRPGERNPRHAQLLRVIGAAAALGDAFERGGPVDVAAIVGARPIAAARSTSCSPTARRSRPAMGRCRKASDRPHSPRVLREFTRVLSPQTFLLLLGLTAIAALILVGRRAGSGRQRSRGVHVDLSRVLRGPLAAHPLRGLPDAGRGARA